MKRFYAAVEVEALRREADAAGQEAAVAGRARPTTAEDAIAQFRAIYPMQLQFPYRFRAQEKPFFVSAIYHDGQFTYIRTQASELPSLYELRDGTPNLVSFQVEHGLYIVPKVVERGYSRSGNSASSSHTRPRGEDMDPEPTPSDPPLEPTGPRAAIHDRRPALRGVLPRQAQTWIMVSLAVLILVVILITGRRTPEPIVSRW